MFRAFLVYAIEDYSRIPAVEGLLRQDFKGHLPTTDSPDKTKKRLDELERRIGFVHWKTVPQPGYNLAVSEIALNVNPYYMQWEIVFQALKENLAIEWGHWAAWK